MKLILAALLILLVAACHPIVRAPAIDIKPHVAPVVNLVPTVTPDTRIPTPTPAKGRN